MALLDGGRLIGASAGNGAGYTAVDVGVIVGTNGSSRGFGNDLEQTRAIMEELSFGILPADFLETVDPIQAIYDAYQSVQQGHLGSAAAGVAASRIPGGKFAKNKLADAIQRINRTGGPKSSNLDTRKAITLDNRQADRDFYNSLQRAQDVGTPEPRTFWQKSIMFLDVIRRTFSG
ncbi:MAG: hypothetical protein WDZ30_01500 [Cellvibrionaceae bacterium]